MIVSLLIKIWYMLFIIMLTCILVPYMQVICEIPYVFGQTIFFSVIVYPMVSFEWKVAKVCWFFFVSFFSFLYFTYYGMMTVSITPNHQVAAIFGAAFYGLFNLFSGFFIPRPVSTKSIFYFYFLIITLVIFSDKVPLQKFDISENS